MKFDDALRPADTIVTADLTPELHELLNEKLDTFEKLELMVALRSAGKAMTLADLAVQLQVGREALRRVADEVAASGMIDVSEDDVVRLRAGYWDSLIDEAAEITANEPNKLMRTFTRIAMARIRGMAARTFADAFRIRKKGD